MGSRPARADSTWTGSSGPSGPPPTCGPLRRARHRPRPDGDCSTADEPLPAHDRGHGRPCPGATRSRSSLSWPLPALTATIGDSPGVALSFVGSGGQPDLTGDVANQGAFVSFATAWLEPREHLHPEQRPRAPPLRSARRLGGGVAPTASSPPPPRQACSFGGGVTFTNSVCSSSWTSYLGSGVLATDGLEHAAKRRHLGRGRSLRHGGHLPAGSPATTPWSTRSSAPTMAPASGRTFTPTPTDRRGRR